MKKLLKNRDIYTTKNYNSMKYFPKKIKISIKTVGGELPSPAILAPKLGPIGLSAKKIGEDIAKKTIKNWKSIVVTVLLVAYKKNIKIKILPSASSLLKRELLKKYGTNNINEKRNLPIQKIVKIAKVIKKRSYAKDILGSVKEVLGTCNTLNIYVNNIKPKIITKKISLNLINLKIE